MSAVEFVPPHNLEAEQSALGSMMLERDALLQGLEALEEQDFYRPVHSIVYRACAELANRNEPVELITLSEELRSKGALENIGGAEYLMSLVESVPTAANFKHYAEIVKDKALRRNLIVAAKEVESAARDDDNESPVDVLTAAAIRLSDTRKSQTKTQRDVVNAVYQQLDSYQRGGKKQGVSFGLPRLDKVLYGVCPGDFVVIAARPSEGKSVLLSDVILNAGRESIPTLVFSMEMSAESLMERMVYSQTRIDSTMARIGVIGPHEWDRVGEVCGDLYEAPTTWEDYPCPLPALIAKAKRWHVKEVKDRGIIVVDYLQLVQVASKKRNYNRTQELGELTIALKHLSRMPGVAVVAAAQLNRDSAKRESGRPALHDLREAGTLEADLDKGIFIRNPPDGELDENKMRDGEIAVLKHRNGATSHWFPVKFHGPTTTFTEVDKRHETD